MLVLREGGQRRTENGDKDKQDSATLHESPRHGRLNATIRRMRRALIVLLLCPVALAAQSRAKNVILFIADAGGISTIAAASLHGYNAPRRLFVQRMPHIGLSETSSASHLVTDSAAGMTAIVTGQRTNNGVVGQSASAVRGKVDGEPLKTILEYAEERGLSTGIVTDDSPAGATPASLYAKASERATTASIFRQLFTPKYGDGVDVVITAGFGAITKALAAEKLELDAYARERGRPILRAIADIPPNSNRAVVLLDSGEFDKDEAVAAAIRILSKNRRGYFLMVEADTHANPIRRGLDRLVALDKVIEKTAKAAGSDTLVLFTADHSFDVRIRGGVPGQVLLEGLEAAETAAPKGPIRITTLRMDNGHAGEEVLAAAQGPGAQRLRGYMANTDLFRVMMDAYGWPIPKTPTTSAPAAARDR
jgi:alkaline phosphatase